MKEIVLKSFDNSFFEVKNPYNILYLNNMLGIYTNPHYINSDGSYVNIETFGELKKLAKNNVKIYIEEKYRETYEDELKKLIKMAHNIIQYNEE